MKPDPLLPQFLDQIESYCKSKHGRITALANALGIARETVSAWITVRKQEPGGEAVLQMQAWLANEMSETPKKFPEN